MTKEEFIAMINQLEDDFYTCEGGSTALVIDGHEYHTDAAYAMDGIRAFAQVLRERLLR